MSDGIYSALSGAIAQQRALDTVANNVANVGTVGFRGDQVAFQEAVSRAQAGPGPDSLRYVTVSEVGTDQSDGPLSQTGNPLDVALQGDGLFAVQTGDGIRYTRAGSFRIDDQGMIRTPGGHALLQADPPDPAHPEIQLPQGNDIQISDTGTIMVDGQEAARIRIQTFASENLQKEGVTLYRGQGQGQPAESVQVLQGYLEGANVNPVSGMNELITASRSFEAFQRVIQAFRQIDEKAAREVGSSR